MRPIAIFMHAPTEGPGYFAIDLSRRGLPWRLIRLDVGEPVPAAPDGFSGLAFMGGAMSVNDPLPWIEPALSLIRRAVEVGVPVIGHCLGGQLMSTALGGVVTPMRGREIGWHRIEVADSDPAQAWFGTVRSFLGFHWHGETFSVPAGGIPVLSSMLCRNQGFVLGPHIALQCHVEMTRELVHAWCHTGTEEILRFAGPGVQTVPQICTDLSARLSGLHAIADGIYARWAAGLGRSSR